MKPAIIFVHGGFVCQSIWQPVIPLLEARGHVARALDLPGSGAYARVPLAFGKRPLDAAAFAAEVINAGRREPKDRDELVREFTEAAEDDLDALAAIAAEIDAVHAPVYREGLAALAGRHARLDADTATSPGSWEAALRAAGVVVTLNSDDPALFGGWLTEVFAAAADFHLDPGSSYTTASGHDYSTPAATPEPASLVLLGLGVLTLAGYGRRCQATRSCELPV